MSDNGLRPELTDLWHTYFLGMQLVQTYTDAFYCWETFLNAHPFKTLIELGTGSGAFSTLLYFQCVNRGATFWTVDTAHVPAFDWPINMAMDTKAKCWIGGNMWEQSGAWPRIHDVLANGERPLILFCDGGNKPREFQTFVPSLRPGDFAVVHDYGTEFGDNDAAPVGHLVKQIFPEAKAVGSKTAWFERV